MNQNEKQKDGPTFVLAKYLSTYVDGALYERPAGAEIPEDVVRKLSPQPLATFIEDGYFKDMGPQQSEEFSTYSSQHIESEQSLADALADGQPQSESPYSDPVAKAQADQEALDRQEEENPGAQQITEAPLPESVSIDSSAQLAEALAESPKDSEEMGETSAISDSSLEETPPAAETQTGEETPPAAETQTGEETPPAAETQTGEETPPAAPAAPAAPAEPAKPAAKAPAKASSKAGAKAESKPAANPFGGVKS